MKMHERGKEEGDREREGRRRRGTHTFLKNAQTKEFNRVRKRERNR